MDAGEMQPVWKTFLSYHQFMFDQNVSQYSTFICNHLIYWETCWDELVIYYRCSKSQGEALNTPCGCSTLGTDFIFFSWMSFVCFVIVKNNQINPSGNLKTPAKHLDVQIFQIDLDHMSHDLWPFWNQNADIHWHKDTDTPQKYAFYETES